jgi:8-oxo-dGTP pyrophosphatase MutT (NUDIX family)
MAKSSFNKSRCYGGIIKCSSTGKYLLVKGFTGKWSFPKGHREKNESPIECAKREIYEETGIKIDDIQNKRAIFVSLYYYFNIVFDEEVAVQPIDTTEILDSKWFLPEETNYIDKNKDVNVYFSKLLKATFNNKNNIVERSITNNINIPKTEI